MKILVIEDSLEAQKLIQIGIQDMAIVRFAESLAVGRELLQEDKYDLILLDLNLPDGDGLDLCQEVQLYPYRIPVIVVSGKSEVDDRIHSLVAGADDHINKPFDMRELRARIESVIRRFKLSPRASQLMIGNLKVNLLHQKVEHDEKPIDLTPIEYRIFVALGQSLNMVINREDLYERLWGEDVHVSQRNIDAHVSKLRKKVQDFGFVIHSKRGEGYALVYSEQPIKTAQKGSELPRGL